MAAAFGYIPAMRIERVETHVCNARMRNWVFVKVVTDQPGLWGWGEATLEWHTRGIVGAIEDLAPLVVGADPTRIEHLWQTMVRQHFWHGHGIERATAIAGIDIALWDILGKVAGMPCAVSCAAAPQLRQKMPGGGVMSVRARPTRPVKAECGCMVGSVPKPASR